MKFIRLREFKSRKYSLKNIFFIAPSQKRTDTHTGVCSFFVEIGFSMTSAGGTGLGSRAPPVAEAARTRREKIRSFGCASAKQKRLYFRQGNEKSHPRNQKRKPPNWVVFLFHFFSSPFLLSKFFVATETHSRYCVAFF